MNNPLVEKKIYNSLAIFFKSDFKRLRNLFSLHGSWRAVGDSLSDDLNIDRDWAELEKFDVGLVLKDELSFPSSLHGILDCPNGLYFRGNFSSWDSLMIGVVGTRKTSKAGIENTKNISGELARAGVVVVSGLALGVDGAAHLACVELERPTIAVLANGLESIYPRENERLAKNILKYGGLILSEYPLFTPSLARYFLARNRIVSGLSKALIIVEAPYKSGAISTATLANKQGCRVFALPGPITSFNHKGTNNLIKNGDATLFTDTRDVLASLGYKQNAGRITTSPTSPLDKKSQIILTGLMASADLIDCDQIAELTDLNIEDVNEAIGTLVVENLVGEDGGKYFLIK